MPQERRELFQRLSSASPKDCVRGASFRAALGEAERLCPGHAGLQGLKLRYGKTIWVELFNYPVADYLNLLWDAADLIEPAAGSPIEALRALGAAATQHFLDSVVGKLAVSMVRGKPPIDILSYAPSVYAPTATYGTRTFERLSAERGVIRMRGDFAPPEYHVGVLRTGVGINGHRVDIKIDRLSLLDFDFQVTWDGAPAAVRPPAPIAVAKERPTAQS